MGTYPTAKTQNMKSAPAIAIFKEMVRYYVPQNYYYITTNKFTTFEEFKKKLSAINTNGAWLKHRRSINSKTYRKL